LFSPKLSYVICPWSDCYARKSQSTLTFV